METKTNSLDELFSQLFQVVIGSVVKATIEDSQESEEEA